MDGYESCSRPLEIEDGRCPTLVMIQIASFGVLCRRHLFVDQSSWSRQEFFFFVCFLFIVMTIKMPPCSVYPFQTGTQLRLFGWMEMTKDFPRCVFHNRVQVDTYENKPKEAFLTAQQLMSSSRFGSRVLRFTSSGRSNTVVRSSWQQRGGWT
jgi:hypothetical protein